MHRNEISGDSVSEGLIRLWQQAKHAQRRMALHIPISPLPSLQDLETKLECFGSPSLTHTLSPSPITPSLAH